MIKYDKIIHDIIYDINNDIIDYDIIYDIIAYPFLLLYDFVKKA